MTPETQIARLEQVIDELTADLRKQLNKSVFDEELAWQLQHGPDPSVDREAAYIMAWLVESEQLLDWMRSEYEAGRLVATPTDEPPL